MTDTQTPPEVTRITILSDSIFKIAGYAYKKANSKKVFFTPSRVLADIRAHRAGLLFIPNL